MEPKTTVEIKQTATCKGCGGTHVFTWGPGLTRGKHEKRTKCPCGQEHIWIIELH